MLLPMFPEDLLEAAGAGAGAPSVEDEGKEEEDTRALEIAV